MTVVFRSDPMITNLGFYAMFNAITQDEKDSGGKPQAVFGVKNQKPFGV